MRWIACAILFAEILHAQQTMPSGIVHGSVIAATGGSLSVRSADGVVYDCSYDRLTLFQRNHWPIRAVDLNGGEPVEILADRRAAVPCYVRMLSVVYPQPTSPRHRAQQKEVWQPHRYLSYAGMVVSANAAMFTIKTSAGPRTLRLREDTHYSDATQPLVNKHVFVQAGRNQQGALEAYQVVWGEILAVR